METYTATGSALFEAGGYPDAELSLQRSLARVLQRYPVLEEFLELRKAEASGRSTVMGFRKSKLQLQDIERLAEGLQNAVQDAYFEAAVTATVLIYFRGPLKAESILLYWNPNGDATHEEIESSVKFVSGVPMESIFGKFNGARTLESALLEASVDSPLEDYRRKQ